MDTYTHKYIHATDMSEYLAGCGYSVTPSTVAALPGVVSRITPAELKKYNIDTSIKMHA